MFQYIALRLFIGCFRFIPYSLQCAFFTLLVRLFLRCSGRYRGIVLKNFEIVFPDLSESERKQLLYDSAAALAQTIADTLRVPRLDRDWFLANVSFPQAEEFKEIVQAVSPKGVLCVGGHLGSFELLPSAAAAHSGLRGKVVAREFKNERLNRWWNERRSTHGVEIINRKGALRKILKSLKRGGGYVGILYDQNVTRNLATFVDWFGIPAATTVAVGYAAVKIEAPVLVCSIENQPGGRYEILFKKVEVDSICQDDSLSFDEKVQAVTQKVTIVFEDYIRQQPAGWFWMHRRWKTRPLENDPAIYPGSK